MKSKRYILIFSIAITLLFSTINAQGKNVNFFNDVVNIAKGSIVETGIKLSYHIEDYGKEALEREFRELNLNGIDNVEFGLEHGHNILKFSSEKIRGSIENLKEASGSIIIINLTEETAYNKTDEIKNKVAEKIITTKSIKEYSQYVKAMVSSEDMFKTNEIILKYLKDIGAINIDTIKISNGFSTVANTKQFKTVKGNGKAIDFNFAVVNYTTGNYIILGTPLIPVPY